jgi:hypothetical protein
VRHIPLALCSAAVCATQGSQTVAHAHVHSGQLDAPPKGAQGVTTDHPVPVTARLAQLLPLSATQYVWPLHITCPPKVLGPTPGVVLHRLYCMVGTDTFKATAATGSAEQTSASAVARRFRLGDDIVVARGRSVGCVRQLETLLRTYCVGTGSLLRRCPAHGPSSSLVDLYNSTSASPTSGLCAAVRAARVKRAAVQLLGAA